MPYDLEKDGERRKDAERRARVDVYERVAKQAAKKAILEREAELAEAKKKQAPPPTPKKKPFDPFDV